MKTSKRGRIIINPHDYQLFGFEQKPVNITGERLIDGHTKLHIIEVTAAYKSLTFGRWKGDWKTVTKVLSEQEFDKIYN